LEFKEFIEERDEMYDASSAICDECYSKALLSIERDRALIDNERKNIQ